MTSSTTSDKPGDKSALPMALTLARLALAPIVAALIFLAGHGIFTHGVAFAGLLYAGACALFIVAALTDWADGALARKLGAVTPLGAALDHIADKALTASAFIALTATVLPLDLAIAGLILIVRDLAIGGLREALPGALPVDRLGKLKAASAMAGLAAYLAFQAASLLGGPLIALQGLIWLARTLIWAAALLSLLSAGRYVAGVLRR